MRVLVTGGAGFLGSHLCDRLILDGHDVVAMDNLITGSAGNISHLAANPRFSFIRHDVTEYILLDGPLDFVLHFASPASPTDYLRLPIETLKAGALGTHNTLGLAKAKGCGFLLASTSEVYGDPLIHPQMEEYWGNVNPVGPRGVYDEAKRFSEALTMAYHRNNGIDTRIARIFNTYGPRMRIGDGRAVPTMIDQAIRGEALTVFGDGGQTRSFCFVADTIDGIVRLMHRGFHDPVNIGNPDEMTVLELAHAVLRLAGSRSAVAFAPLPVDDPMVRRPDISLARRILGWEPKVPLTEGLETTIKWFRDGPCRC
jgi:dTDP-glucose 4,6-dehydratase